MLGGDGLQVAVQELISLTFEIQEHDAVAELGMAGYDSPLDGYGGVTEPEGELHTDAQWEGRYQLDVAAASTEVGGFQAHGEVAAFLADFDLDLDGIAGMVAAIWFSGSGGGRLGVGQNHGLAPGLGGVSWLHGPWVDHRRKGWARLGRASQMSGYEGECPGRAARTAEDGWSQLEFTRMRNQLTCSTV